MWRRRFVMSGNDNNNAAPWGMRAILSLGCCCPRLTLNKPLFYRSSVLLLTYVSYMTYHLARKTISVVKNVLHQNCTTLVPPPDIHVDPNNSTWCDWAPFDGSDGDANALLGTLDSAFLFAYAGAMFVSGFVAERVNLRYFLCWGMIFSGIFSCMFGLARPYNIHSFAFFIVAQIGAGIAQTTGWPGVVTVVGKWFGKSKRGLIFGIWNSHTSIGNILGTLIAARFLDTDWSLSFIVPGFIIGAVGVIVYLFLVVDPTDVGLLPPDRTAGNVNSTRKDQYRRAGGNNDHSSSDEEQSRSDETQVLISPESGHLSHRSINNDPGVVVIQRDESSSLLHHNAPTAKAVGFIEALKIPGVIEFSLSLFFAKLVSYTFLYWLPLYIRNSTSLSPAKSADLSTWFDVGGIAGAILAGVISDMSGMSATTCAVMLIIAAPMMMIYEWFGTISYTMNVFLLIIVGLFVNGPYALITTAVSAELGTHKSLEGNSKALATVTAIIDGTGSIGAAIGPLLAALVSSKGWSKVFIMLIVCDILALVLLIRLVTHELRRCGRTNRAP